MISLAATILHLVLEAAPAPACEVTDNACKAREFIAKARTAAPGPRAMLLFTAHKSYLALFAQTGKVRDLCAARANFDRSVGVKGQSDSQRARFEEARAELEALEQRHGARCGPSAQRRKQAEPTPIALTHTPEPSTMDPAPEAAPVVTESQIASTTGPKPTWRTVEGPLAVPMAPVSDRAESQALRSSSSRSPRGRPLVIAGGATLGASLVLIGVAGYAGSQVAGLTRATRELYENAHGDGDGPALRVEEGLRSDLAHWVPVTVGTAIAAGTAVVVGAVLVHVGLRRAKDGPPQTALVPTPGGLAIHARF